MATLYTHQDQNIRKTWVLMTLFLVSVIGIGWAFSFVLDNVFILYVAVAVSILMNIWSYWYSDKIVLAIAGGKQVSREAYPDLWNITENLAITAGLPMPKLYLIHDDAPNAFATGRDKTHAAVAVTTGLLSMLDRSEIEGVIAHELAHIGNRDILLTTIVVILVGFVTLLSDFFLRMTFYGHGGGRDRDGRVQMILLLIGIVLAIVAPLVAMVIQLAISRKREFLADASGALLTRYPEGLARALEKIFSYTQDLKRANHATAHLYIANPFNSQKSRRGFFTKLFMTHPPVEERIAALRGRREV